MFFLILNFIKAIMKKLLFLFSIKSSQKFIINITFFILFIFVSSNYIYSQDGSIGNPFTNVNQVNNATPNGSYYFNLGGTTIQTKVENGWVLVANDVGTPIQQSLQEVTNLDVTIRGIVSNTVLANLGDIDQVKIRSSDGAIDVVSNNATIISRVKAGETIHQGQSDNAINDSWTGASAGNITANGACPTTHGNSLKSNIIDVCGFFQGTRWIPINADRAISYFSFNVADNISFGLWVRKDATVILPTITSLSTLSGCQGSSLVINGTNLTNAQTVTIGGTPAIITNVTSTAVTVTVSSGTTGTVSITTPSGTATSTEVFTVLSGGILGSVCNPFTNVNQVTDFTPNGNYFFNFGGTLINTFVENGWVLILNDVGSPSNQPIASNVLLDKTVRGKLSDVVLANLGDFNSINIKSSGGEVDAIISEPILVNRIKQGKTLHTGVSDNAINNAWFGSASAISLNADANCPTSFADDLSANVFHTCGANDGFTWIPINAERKITLASGNVANNVGFGLWVKSTSAVAGANGASLWLKGNDGLFNSGTTITDWIDQTGNNVFTVIGSPGYKPNAVNFNAAARFDNEETWNVLPASRLEGNTEITYVDGFAVYFYETEAPTFRFGTFLGSVGAPVSPADLGVGVFASAGNRSAYASNGVIGLNIHFVDPIAETNTRYNVSNLDVELAVAPYGTGRSNGIQQTILNGSNQTLLDFPSIAFKPMIGGTTNPTVSPGQPGFRHMKGEVAEIILYPRSLPLIDKQKIESYLAIKYGISLGSNSVAIDYINGLGNIVWPGNATYKFDVFGIGRDDMSTLNQSSSNSINTGSGDGTGQSGKGNIVINNPSSLENGDFLLMGHDNAGLTEQTTEVPTAGQKRIIREWFVERTGDPGTVDLSFDILGLTLTGAASTDFKLLIDSDGDFSSGATEINATSLTGTKVAFTSVSVPDGSYLTIVTGFAPQVGPGVLGANLWLKANDGVSSSGSNLTGWIDQTSNNTFTVFGAPAYIQNAINFNPSVKFTDALNINTVLPTDRLEGNTSITLTNAFAVFKSNPATVATIRTLMGSTNPSSQSGANVFGYSNSDFYVRDLNGNLQSYQNNSIDTGFHINYIDVTPTTAPFIAARINGSDVIAMPNIGNDFNEISHIPLVGGSNNASDGAFSFNGEVAEVIYYPSLLNVNDKRKIESYLAIKYGITLDPSIVNYVNSAGTTLWDNITYWHDVFGIGKDDDSSLNQPQSNSINTGSGDGIGQSGKGNIILSNPSSLDDGDFLMIGHDNASLNLQSNDLPIGLGLNRLSREWKVKTTNNPGTVTLDFNIDGITSVAGASDFKLLIDSDGDGDFTTGSVSVIDASSNNGSRIEFSSVAFSDGVVFTLAFSGACYKPGINTTGALSSSVGITSLERTDLGNGIWPMVRKGGWLVLESKTMGFVINRIDTTAQVNAIPNPVEGMMVYDKEADCLKINIDGTSSGWKCFNTQACPD